MREFTCAVCGKSATSRGCGIEQKYCSKECREIAIRLKYGWSGTDGPSCLYNQGVVCEVQRCETCGWNPAVEKKRIEELREVVI